MLALDSLGRPNVAGECFAEIVVEGRLIVELKRCEEFAKEHTAQCINYLKATGVQYDPAR